MAVPMREGPHKLDYEHTSGTSTPAWMQVVAATLFLVYLLVRCIFVAAIITLVLQIVIACWG